MVLRSVQAIATPLANYVRPSRRDHRFLLDLAAEEALPSGLVVDPTLWHLQAELAEEANRQKVEVVMDPQALELATPVGFARRGMADLPWAGTQVHTAKDVSRSATEMARSIAEFVAERPITAVLAPTHYLATSKSEWLSVDIEMAGELRQQLDAVGRSGTPLYYPLALHAELLRDAGFRRRLMESLRGTPLDSIWLKVHPFGSSSGPMAMKRYVEACRDFHALGVPLVGERTGTIGVALAAFGAVGGVEGGVTFGERFDVSPLMKPSDGKPFAPPPKVYLSDIGLLVLRKQAEALFEHRGMKAAFGCQQCCRRGVTDMIANPRRHFMLTRSRELGHLSNMPEPLRAGQYLEQFLRPATDLALRAARALPDLENHRRRLEARREALGALHARDRETAITYSQAPTGVRVQRRLGA